MEKEERKCPKCGSENVRWKRSWSSVGIWGALFVIALILSQTLRGGGDQMAAGLTSMTVLLGFVTVIFALMAKYGGNYCRDCKHTWS